jgi:hypothetical protein
MRHIEFCALPLMQHSCYSLELNPPDILESLVNGAQTQKQQANLVDRVLLVLILASVFFCAALLAFSIWFAVTPIGSLHMNQNQCVAIKDDSARLECYDSQAGRRPTPPARGAKPPELPFGR